QDALCPTAQRFFRPELHAVGLHACGELHMQLLRHGIHAACEAMTISPCCYHKISAEHYQPMSQVANQSTLQLSRHDLRLSLQESVTGGERIRRLRRLEVSYR
ncbi:MAG: methyltransferase, partial [Plesiomonas shigelloides]